MAEPFVAPRRAWAWEQRTRLAGVAAVVLWIVSSVVSGSQPDAFEATGQEWLTYLTGHERQMIASRVLFLLGVFLFIWFVSAVRASLLAAEEEPRRWTTIAFGSGIATAVLMIASSTPLLAAAAVAGTLEPAAAQALAVAELGFFFGMEIAAAAFLAATGLLALRTRVLPSWLGWASLVLALLLLIIDTPIGFVALLLGFPLWVLVVSLLLWRRGERAALRRQTTTPEATPS